jgi:DNA polymerase III subunit delta'
MWQTVGQESAIDLLEKEYSSGRMSHAYLFTGPELVGKTTLAIDFACAINCPESKPPCGGCQSCSKIVQRKHADIQIIGLNNAEKNGDSRQKYEISIEEIRNIQKTSSLPPYEGRYRVFIIDNAEHLSEEAANCLLKILEEPQPNIVFILLASDESSLLPTIRSRCQKIELKPLPQHKITDYLENSLKTNRETAELLARISRGCIGLAISSVKDDSYLQFRSKSYSELIPLLGADWSERFKQAAQMEHTRKTSLEILELWNLWWRDVMLVKCQCTDNILNVDYLDTIQKWASLVSLPEINYFLDCLHRSRDYLTRNVNPKLVFEVLLLDMPRIRAA